ncbi:MAG: helix-turn-helix domain-containing protein [Nocardiopsaceae bacterium]|nr:helix-turn-helix domain-containing protein [Nocardiopsaceae bacterium]
MADDGTVVGRVAEILEAVADAGGPLTLAELARGTGIPKPTARRIAASLIERGLLDRTPDGYVLGGRLLRYGLHALIRHPAMLAAQPYLQDLHQRSGGELAWFGILHDGELTLADAVFGRAHQIPLRTSAWPGTALLGPSVVLLASGRLQVAHHPDQADRILSAGWTRMTRYSVTDPRRMRDLLAEARDTGFAQEEEQTRLGWGCVAAVLRDPGGQMIGAIGVTGRTATIAARGLRGGLLRSSHALQGELAAPYP